MAMGTPSLWATIETYLTQRFDIDETVQSLSRSLEWSAYSPLTVHVAAWNDHATPGLELLAGHCRKWRAAGILMYGVDAAASLSRIRGNLPLLESLDLNVGRMDVERFDIFEIAPKLTRVTLVTQGVAPTLPWMQLRRVTFDSSFLNQYMSNVLAVMRCCSSECAFRLCGLDATDWAIPIQQLGSATSDIWSLEFTLRDMSGSDHSREALGALLARFTFPCMRSLHFRSRLQDPPLHWPRKDFAVFVARSFLGERLTTLHLHDMGDGCWMDDSQETCDTGLRSYPHL